MVKVFGYYCNWDRLMSHLKHMCLRWSNDDDDDDDDNDEDDDDSYYLLGIS